jgi:ABC-2 type transport system ATP-binding protein
MTTEIVRVTGLHKQYRGRPAVDGIDLSVVAGTCVALLGPNGAGKSTTVEILEGYRQRDGGEVTVLGVDPSAGNASWRSRIGIVLQTSQPPAELTVREMLTQFAAYYPNPRSIVETIALVGLAEQSDKRSKQLSGGQLRRLDVGLGIIGRPELLFLDEPTTGFDPEARRSFWDLIRMLRAEGTTVLLTTHYMEEAAELADRVVVLSGGRIVADSPPNELGGRDRAASIVRWMEGGQVRSEATATPSALVAQLMERFGGEVPDLTVARPSLEDAYLALIGDHP